MKKLLTKQEIPSVLNELKTGNKKIVFTNGCFDIVHLGHLKLLQKCKEFGTVIVGLNSDSSIKKIKGKTRPINNLNYRIEYLSQLDCVDYIIVFDEDTPLKLIEMISPDYLIKGSDYSPESIAGYNHVVSYGGKVLTFGFNINQSTTNIINKSKKNDSYNLNLQIRINLYSQILNDYNLKKSIDLANKILTNCFKNNGKLFIAGNGGSAEQANHFVAELMGHYKDKTKYLPAISLCENISLVTALANDYCYSEVFKRSFSPLANKNDTLFVISSSGNSENICKILKYAKEKQISSILLTSTNVNKDIEQIANCTIKVNSTQCDVIQEAHLFIIHYLSEILKNE